MEIKTVQEFINLISSSVVDNCRKHGWGVPSAIIAQAILESMKSTGWSGLASSCFNFWGMKWKSGCGCDYKEYSTKEQKTDGSYYTIVSRFRKFLTVESGVDGYFNFIESYPRYKVVMASKSYTEYATKIREAGWATSLGYTKNIINTVNKYGLTKYDTLSPIENNSSYVIGKTYTTTIDLNIRDNPNGNKVKYECITEDGKKHSKFDTYGNAVLSKGTRVTCQDFKCTGYATWIKIPSGWICGISGNNIYIPL